MSDLLQILALDPEDLTTISALTQDAVVKSSDIEFLGHQGVLVLPFRRFAWEAKSARRWMFKKYERRLSVLRLSNIANMKTRGIDKNDHDQVLSLLAITFTPDEIIEPGGNILLTFAGNADIALEIECVEALLSDLGAVWSADNKPRHIV